MHLRRLAALWRLCVALAALCWLALPALAQEPLRGVALVIGQSAYQQDSGLRELRNPEADALDLRELLRDLGFEVSAPVLDADGDDLRDALADFAEDAAGA